MRRVGNYKKLLLIKINVNFFISRLVSESSLDRLNQQSSQVEKFFYSALSHQPSWSIYA